ncbi:hypothetical protein BD770DRAFT_376236 [Pilaira anomala]|nr:hypothetical protein BD770DRAFT_376236 [Pilaira anomala]
MSCGHSKKVLNSLFVPIMFENLPFCISADNSKKYPGLFLVETFITFYAFLHEIRWSVPTGITGIYSFVITLSSSLIYMSMVVCKTVCKHFTYINNKKGIVIIIVMLIVSSTTRRAKKKK